MLEERQITARKFAVALGLQLTIAAIGAGMLLALYHSFAPVQPAILDHIRCGGNDAIPDGRDCSKASGAFASIVSRRFPVGSNEAALERELVREGFSRADARNAHCAPQTNKRTGEASARCASGSPKRRSLTYSTCKVSLFGFVEFPWIMCGRELGVLWSSDTQERITHIEAYYRKAIMP